MKFGAAGGMALPGVLQLNHDHGGASQAFSFTNGRTYISLPIGLKPVFRVFDL